MYTHNPCKHTNFMLMPKTAPMHSTSTTPILCRYYDIVMYVILQAAGELSSSNLLSVGGDALSS